MAGDEVDISIEVDTESREVILTSDFAVALTENAQAKVFFEQLSFSNQCRHVLLIEQAKSIETRQRRIVASVAMLQEGKA
ncbi:YdeI/OmpD-associated family protein [Spirosoma aureum]|uniref:YdeI/OmpD-associated family protein n=1 Tax=Spirosoma aureum TaxID=2692134 RepID=UPI003742E34F